MKLPGPDHPIVIVPEARSVRVIVAGRTVAETVRGLRLSEAGYPPVHYIPRDDVEMALLERTVHATYCPYKGDASYFLLRLGGRTVMNVAWSYEHPYPAMAAIAGFLAFAPERVEVIVLDR